MFSNGFWKRAAAFALGCAGVAAGSVFGQPALIAAGLGLVGWSIPFPGDKPTNGDAQPPQGK